MAICPYCEKPVTLRESGPSGVRVRRESLGRVKKEVMYSCPHCDRVLGFAYFMGGLLTGRP